MVWNGEVAAVWVVVNHVASRVVIICEAQLGKGPAGGSTRDYWEGRHQTDASTSAMVTAGIGKPCCLRTFRIP